MARAAKKSALKERAGRRLAEMWEKLRGYPKLKARFLKRVGYPLDLKHPETFNAKVQVRKLYDLNPIYPILSDKVRAHDHVAAVLGQAEADALFPRLLGTTDRPSSDWLQGFGTGVVVKANHGCGMHCLIGPKDEIDYPALARRCKAWLRTDYGRQKLEWGYRPIPRRILVEEMITFANGAPADDLKFAVFDGVVHFAQLNNDKHSSFENAFVTRDWAPIDIRRKQPLMAVFPDRPAEFDRMVAIAERLGQGMDYVRVDFLLSDQRIALGELTLYTGSGFTPFLPPEYDAVLGEIRKQKIWRA